VVLRWVHRNKATHRFYSKICTFYYKCPFYDKSPLYGKISTYWWWKVI